MADSYRHKGLRNQLVELLREKGIHDEAVLEAINKIPRHAFLDPAFTEQAYQDIAFQIGAGQTISQPYTVAFQTQELQVKKGDKILEIGTGSGYQASVLLAMGAKLVSIERQRELFLKAKVIIDQLGYNPKLSYGDGFKGNEMYAPYDKIIVTCGAPFVPDTLLDQLKPGGRLIIPVGEGEVQKMILITKDLEGNVHREEKGDFRFVPMLKDKAK
ncbi:MAG: protein-L-isoaspartate(D-aspartate) O-methyltransferase [Crocinitomicaceae bacterium]|nr:protein-L-isoaspartate(D-aspartate) O-methyltransferase [Crocinitomicaceae bacterium]